MPAEEGEEIESPNRKVIRVESEEAEDYVRESLNLSREEAQEISFVPSRAQHPTKAHVFGATIGAGDTSPQFLAVCIGSGRGR